MDVQINRLEWEVVGWGENEEQWSIDRGVIFEDPKNSSAWETLDNILKNNRYKHPKGEMSIYATAIDYGGTRGKYVAEFCKPRWNKRVYMVKGSKSLDAPIVTYRGAGNNKYKTPFFMINVNDIKTLFFDSLENGYIHFPKSEKYNDEYFKQLLAEEKKDGRWVKRWKGIRNEALDIKVYNWAVLEIIQEEYKKACSRAEPIIK